MVEDGATCVADESSLIFPVRPSSLQGNVGSLCLCPYPCPCPWTARRYYAWIVYAPSRQAHAPAWTGQTVFARGLGRARDGRVPERGWAAGRWVG